MTIQLSFFSSPYKESHDHAFDERESKNGEPCHWKLYVDGASRNNPGKSGAGIYILKNGKELLRQGFFLGIKTNNEAEYLATILGLFFIEKQYKPFDTLTVISDSLLVVRQLEGLFKVRKKELMPLYTIAHTIIKACKGTVNHIFRSENVCADSMANEGIDKQVIVPQEFIQRLKRHGIEIYL